MRNLAWLSILAWIIGSVGEVRADEVRRFEAAVRRPDGMPIVIAHRGASGLLPEHSIAAYRLALEQGADLIEPDLALTKDGELVATHDTTLNRTTDIANRPEFAGRSVQNSKGQPLWNVRDFTLAELKTLRLRQGFGTRPTGHDGKEAIPTFAEIVELVQRYRAATGENRGLCPELKMGAADKALGHNVATIFARTLRALNLDEPTAPPMVIQCFDLDTLIALRPLTHHPLLFLSATRPKPETIEKLKGVAQFIGIEATHVLSADGAEWVKAMHGIGLGIHAWTFRDDKKREGYPSATDEIRAAVRNGIDGSFTDFPATGVTATRGRVR